MRKLLYVLSAVLIGLAVKLKLKTDTPNHPPIELEPELPHKHSKHIDGEHESTTGEVDDSDEDNDEDIEDDDMVSCVDDNCEREFKNEQGMKIHYGIVHEDDEDEE